MSVRIFVSACLHERRPVTRRVQIGASQRWVTLLWIGAASWSLSPLTWAQESSADILDRLRSCVTEKNDTRRLACFDEHLRGQFPGPAAAAAAASGSTAPASVQANSPPSATTPVTPAPTPQQQFGMEGVVQRRQQVAAASQSSPPLKQIQAHIQAVSYRPQGEAVVTLDNAEVWEETELSTHLELRPGDLATVKRGLLGAFWLYTDRVPALRVTRRK
jgi:hypothetical protein